MRCSNCGTDIEQDELFCRNCGHRSAAHQGTGRETEPTAIMPPPTSVANINPPGPSSMPGSGVQPPGSIPYQPASAQYQPGPSAPYQPGPSAARDYPQQRAKGSGKLVFGGLILVLLLLGGGYGLYRYFYGGTAASSKDVILRLHGSNTIGAKLAPALVEEFLQEEGAKEIKRIPGDVPDEMKIQAIMPGDTSPKFIEIKAKGSGTAFESLEKGLCDIGMSSRKIKAEETKKLTKLGDMESPSSEHVLALDGIAVIVNRSNPVAKLTRDEIKKIFTGEISDWSKVSDEMSGSIAVYARDDKSGTYDSFKELVLKDGKLVGSAKRFEDSSELSDKVAKDPKGIGFIGLPYIKNAKALAVSEGDAAPLMPTALTVAAEDYLLSRRLFLYTPPNSENALVTKFIDFALGEKGQELVKKEKFVAVADKPEKMDTAKMDAPEEYKDLVEGAEKFPLNFRFRPGSKQLDNKALQNMDFVVEYLAESKNRNKKIILVGFADNKGGADVNARVSKDRAQAVKTELVQRGVKSEITPEGFGSANPVASNDTEDGREKNRRVEIWLQQ